MEKPPAKLLPFTDKSVLCGYCKSQPITQKGQLYTPVYYQVLFPNMPRSK